MKRISRKRHKEELKRRAKERWRKERMQKLRQRNEDRRQLAGKL